MRASAETNILHERRIICHVFFLYKNCGKNFFEMFIFVVAGRCDVAGKFRAACFSRADENDSVGVIEKGYTELVAEEVAWRKSVRLFWEKCKSRASLF